jgi:DNA-nicking Smr family endonuclease
MSRKPYEAPDHALWDEVSRSIKPLTRRHSRKSVVSRAHAPVSPQTVQPAKLTVTKRRVAQAVPPPLAPMDRRTAQKLGRGQIEPESVLDLHGDGLEIARMKLLHYLASQRQHGAKLVLVITGKGASPFARHTLHGISHFHAPEREGRLRREVPFWLGEEVFRHHVVGYQPAHPRHGGGGAFYVRLRKTQASP